MHLSTSFSAKLSPRVNRSYCNYHCHSFDLLTSNKKKKNKALNNIRHHTDVTRCEREDCQTLALTVEPEHCLTVVGSVVCCCTQNTLLIYTHTLVHTESWLMGFVEGKRERERKKRNEISNNSKASAAVSGSADDDGRLVFSSLTTLLHWKVWQTNDDEANLFLFLYSKHFQSRWPCVSN